MAESMWEVMRTRRSVRRYCDQIVPPEVIERLLQAADFAPSGKNRKPWHLCVVTDRDQRCHFAKQTRWSHFMQDAPVLLLVYVLLDGKYPLEKDLLGVGACVQNVLLAAAEQGYGSCVIGELYGKGGGATENSLLVCGITIGKEAL